MYIIFQMQNPNSFHRQYPNYINRLDRHKTVCCEVGKALLEQVLERRQHKTTTHLYDEFLFFLVYYYFYGFRVCQKKCLCCQIV